MNKPRQSGTRTPIILSPVRTRRSLSKKVKEDKNCLKCESSDHAIREPVNKRRRQDEQREDRNKHFSRPRTRSLTFEVEVALPRSEANGEEQDQLSRSSPSRRKGSKRQRQSSRHEPTAVRRSVRESRKVFDSLNEHTLVRSLVGDYLDGRQSGRDSKRRQLLDDGETDSQEEGSSLLQGKLSSENVEEVWSGGKHNRNIKIRAQLRILKCIAIVKEQPGYVSMYDMIKSKSKTSKGGDEEDEEEEEEGDDNEEKGSDEDGDDDNSSDENEEEDDDDVTPQQRYKLREKKPVTKRYTAPPLKEYHSSRRGLFSSSRVHMSERACTSKEPFSPVRKSYKLKRTTINESSTSTEDDEDSDNRKFERRKAKSMAKARSRCLPMNLGLEDVAKGILADRERVGSSLADVDPMNVDRSITFDSIGGLGKHVRSLKEMVVFPLLYPEIFQKFKVNPPRGVLFHGPPGTGKTLMARALANECSQDGKKVAFFMRKGADCLSKWVGESERQLRLLFDQAFKMRPSIIFFDEIDGLAPVRSSRQDQIHSSIVSTLLALMDGLDNRGEIVVIGATNRIDSIDPALRRPGRFDREFIFPLPDKSARRNILSIHTKDWRPRLAHNFINEVADRCVGYCGADIKALCTEATLFALRRRYPQIYASKKKLVLDVETVRVNARDFARAIKTIVPACQRAVVSPGRSLSSSIRPLLQGILMKSWAAVKKIFPPSVSKTVGESSPGTSVNSLALSDSESSDDGTDDADIYEMDPNSTEGARVARAARAARRAGLKGSTSETGNHSQCFPENPLRSKAVHRPRYLICGKQGMGQSTHLSPSILHSMEHLPVHCMDLPSLFGCASKTPEEACAQVFREARRVAPSIVYLPRIESLWNTTTDTLKATFMSLVNDLPPTMPLLLFATSDVPFTMLPTDLSSLFSNELEQVFEVSYPSAKERWAYFEPLFLNEAFKMPCLSKKSKTKKPLEVLPVAPPPEPRELNESELKKIREDEEGTLRELRIFLREITVKLMSDRRFKEFYKPVDLEEVPDYLNVIANPMDLSTMLQKVDGHEYQTCGEYLEDIDLITSNALEYNPNQDTFDRLIRHRACALKDSAHSLIKSQLDLDFEKACEDIVESRKRRGDSRNVCAPKFFPVAPVQSSSRTRDATPVGATHNTPEARNNTTSVATMSRRVQGLDANFNIPIEHLPYKSHPHTSKTPVGRKNVQCETTGLHKSPQRRQIVRSSRNRRRRRRRKSSTSLRKGTPRKSIPEPDHSGPEVELVDIEDQRDVEDANGTIDNRQQTGNEMYGNEEGEMSVDEKNDDAPENAELEEREESNGNVAALKSKSAMEVDGIKDDAPTKNYINSLHVRNEVKSALKSRLDSLNYNHERFPEHDSRCNGREKDCLSETNFSMGTSEISNCDSKDVAELDSILSNSPLPLNGVALIDEVLSSQAAEDVNCSLSEKRLGEPREMAPDPAEKSKRVLFTEGSAGHEMTTAEIPDPASKVPVHEPSMEDKGRLEGLLMELVEATQNTTIETLERYHSKIKQCILEHKKDSSRQRLLEDLKLLLDKFIKSNEIG